MEDAWHIFKWVYVAVLCAYLVVQVLALRRLRGDQKRRSNTVLTVMLLLIFGCDAIRDIFFFEDRTARRMGTVIVAVGAIVATLVSGRLFGEDSAGPESQGNAEQVRPLNMS